MPQNDAPSGADLLIGRWLVRTDVDELQLGDLEVKLEPRTMRLLLALAAEPGRVYSTNELLNQAWPGVVVTQASVYQAIADLRRVMKADEQTASFIATVARKGYRLVAPVSWVSRGVHRASDSREQAWAATSVRDLGPRSVAILPFRTIGLPATHEFVRESLLSSLIGELSRLPHLVVISRGTMLRFGDTPPDPLALREELGVAFVVDGTIACDERGLSIDAELVDTGQRRQVMAERFELALNEWPRMGKSVAARLARPLQLGVAGRTRDEPARPEDLASPALELAMRSWVELYCRPQSRQTNDRAWSWASDVTQRDADIGVAWNALAYCKWRAAQYGWSSQPRDELLQQALRDVCRAIELAPHDPDAHHTMALVWFAQSEPARAEAALLHCLAICPSYAPAHGLLGLIRSHRGFPQEAATHCAKAFELSPSEPLRAIWYWVLALASLMQDDNPLALSFAQMGIAANPDFPSCHVAAAVAAFRTGDRVAARRSIDYLMTRTAFTCVAEVAARLPAAGLPRFGPKLLDDLEIAGMRAGGAVTTGQRTPGH